MLCVIVANLVARRGGGALPGGRDTRGLHGLPGPRGCLPAMLVLARPGPRQHPPGPGSRRTVRAAAGAGQPRRPLRRGDGPRRHAWGWPPACDQKILLLRFYGGMTQDHEQPRPMTLGVKCRPAAAPRSRPLPVQTGQSTTTARCVQDNRHPVRRTK